MYKGNIDEILQFGFKEKLISDIKSIQDLELSFTEDCDQVGIWINKKLSSSSYLYHKDFKKLRMRELINSSL